MFKNILVPTDGSPVSHAAARKAVALARATGAQITAFHVAPAYHFPVREEHVPAGFMLPDDYEAKMQKTADRHLGPVLALAMDGGVACGAHYALSDSPAEAIVSAARRYGCDCIVMGTHARKGLSRLLRGSETQKVLVSTELPVFVTH